MERAVKFLFGDADRIMETLRSVAFKEIGLLWGVEDDLQSLTNTVSTIKAVLLDAEEKQAAGNYAVRDWLGKLEDALYEADDLLDAVSTEALQRKVMTRDKKAKEVRILLSEYNPFARRKTAHKIKDIRERLDAINALARDFHFKVRHVEETRVGGNSDRDNTHSSVCAEAVIGRDKDKKAVINRLLDSNVAENVSIHPIVGIGGLGKTTLAKLIFNDEQFEKNFQLKMWVCVSNPFNVKNVVEKILESATKDKPKPAEMETLVGKLKEEINGKKYLLVLDDVWNEDREKWSRLKEVLMGGAGGSRILVTTRYEIVARICTAVKSYSLSGLDQHASWSLFKQLAFERGQEPGENSSIAAIGKEILAKCSGVPLAIRTIGSLLSFKNSEEEWSSFKKNELSKISQNENDIIPTLKLSYDHLPSHLKHCFAYCRLFPKDYKIERSKVIQLWIAQGFVKLSDQKQCLEDVGDDYFKDLLWRSFFQEAETDEFGNVIECKMHDLMHELAVLVAGSMITTLDDKERNVDKKTRHVSVVGSNIDALSITTSLCKASGMRTFLCPISDNFCGQLDCEAIFSSSKFLRVLDLKGNNLDLPSTRYLHFLPNSITGLMPLTYPKCSIGELKHLRYLDLSRNLNLKKLPNSITGLQNLQTLILSFCEKLEELPGDIKKLVNLRHLEIVGCDGLTSMPCGLGQLTNLQTLSNFVVDKDPLSRDSSGLRELNGLNNLRGELCIQNLRHGKDDVALECKAANLKEKQHLHALDLRWSSDDLDDDSDYDSDVNVDDEELLKVLQLHPNLKRLRLEGNFCSELPSWLLSLTNLVRFELIKCWECTDLPPLSQLPSLKYLTLEHLHALEYILDSNEFSSSFFPSLNKISLEFCPNLKGWWRDSSVEVNSDTNNPSLPSFPCLSTLWISNCSMLTSMPMFPHLEEEMFLRKASWKPVQQTMMMNMAAPQSPTSTATASSSSTPLSKLKYIELDSIADLATLPEESLKNLTSLVSLIIMKCNRLNSLSPGIQHLTALQNLDLENCPELELAINDDDGMQWQGLKSLRSLEFSSLPKLVSLPLGLQHATTLQRLKISNCENLIAIPEWIQNCTSLQLLKIDECSSLTSLPMRSLTALQSLKIKNCPISLQRCESEAGEDWPKIADILELELQQSDNSNTDASSTDSEAEAAEPVQAQKKQRIWGWFQF